MTLWIAWALFAVVFVWSWCSFCRREKARWQAFLEAEREWMRRVEAAEFRDAQAMLDAHPRKQ